MGRRDGDVITGGRGSAENAGLHGFVARLVVRPWFWVAWLALGLAVPIYRSVHRVLPPPAPVLGSVPEFRLTDQDGRPFGTRELRGRVWIANFFFTSCRASCPRLMGQMERVQSRLRNTADAVQLVSFTVDPEVDTPARLYEEARRHHARPGRWSFLTGPLPELEAVIVRGFHMALGNAPAADARQSFFDIVHGNHLVLVDALGRIRGYYPADEQGLDRLLRDVGLLINHLMT